jgi:hypothetical protein
MAATVLEGDWLGTVIEYNEGVLNARPDSGFTLPSLVVHRPSTGALRLPMAMLFLEQLLESNRPTA